MTQLVWYSTTGTRDRTLRELVRCVKATYSVPRLRTARYRRLRLSQPIHFPVRDALLTPSMVIHPSTGTSGWRQAPLLRKQRNNASLLKCAARGRSSQCGTCGFPSVHRQTVLTLGPSWSLRLLAAPSSVGPTVSGSLPTRNRKILPGVCGARRSLQLDPRFLGSPPTHAFANITSLCCL